jgi:2-(1,2-epoxy-1,2-dihydrophenyl)acetyl-CoA isomerase
VSTNEVETIELPLVKLQFEGPLATITLNDPDRLNALGADMAESIAHALVEISKPRRRCRALLIIGEGRGFCAGANLMSNRKALAAGEKQALPALSGTETLYHPLLRRIHGLRIPVIAAVNGIAIGIGLGLALAADYSLVSDKAWFQAPFKNLASASDSGIGWLLSRTIGINKTKRVLMWAERIDAATALDWGMVTEVAPAEGFAERAHELAMEIANGPTLAYGEIKGIIEAAQRSDLHTAFELESQAVARTSRTRDNVAAIKVFGRKDVKPEFTGE